MNLIVKSSDIVNLYRETFKQIYRLPDLENHPKNFKESSALLTLDNYKNENQINFDGKAVKSCFDYEQFVRDGNKMFELEAEHYSKVLFSSGKMDKALIQLNEFPDSKKAVVNLWKGNYKEVESDVPCVVYLWFKRSKGSLFMHAHLRANDAYKILLIDLHILTAIHRFVAEELNLEIGEYLHFVDSMHFYTRDKEDIDALYLKLING